MKKYLLILPILFFYLKANAQNPYVQLYYNPQLVAQLTANQSVRVVSEKTFQNSYGKMQDLYEDANEKLVQVIAIKQQIYRTLSNVNQGLKQGKKVQYIYEDFQKLLAASGDMLELASEYPQYAVFTTKANQAIYTNATELYQLISEQALKEDQKWLMDSMERWNFLNEIHSRIRVMLGYCRSIIHYIENAKYKSYFRHFQALDAWCQQDSALVREILLRYNIITD